MQASYIPDSSDFPGTIRGLFCARVPGGMVGTGGQKSLQRSVFVRTRANLSRTERIWPISGAVAPFRRAFGAKDICILRPQGVEMHCIKVLGALSVRSSPCFGGMVAADSMDHGLGGLNWTEMLSLWCSKMTIYGLVRGPVLGTSCKAVAQMMKHTLLRGSGHNINTK